VLFLEPSTYLDDNFFFLCRLRGRTISFFKLLPVPILLHHHHLLFLLLLILLLLLTSLLGGNIGRRRRRKKKIRYVIAAAARQLSLSVFLDTFSYSFLPLSRPTPSFAWRISILLSSSIIPAPLPRPPLHPHPSFSSLLFFLSIRIFFPFSSSTPPLRFSRYNFVFDKKGNGNARKWNGVRIA
jgi:hypothetical protein